MIALGLSVCLVVTFMVYLFNVPGQVLAKEGCGCGGGLALITARDGWIKNTLMVLLHLSASMGFVLPQTKLQRRHRVPANVP